MVAAAMVYDTAGGQEVAAEFFGHHRVEGEGFTFSFSVGTVLF